MVSIKGFSWATTLGVYISINGQGTRMLKNMKIFGFQREKLELTLEESLTL